MPMNRRHLALASAGAVCTAAFGVTASEAATANNEAGVTQAVEAYRKGLLTADKAQLETLCRDDVTYGHSSGVIQNKAEFVAGATSGKTTWKSISFENLANHVTGDTAYTRFMFVGENESGGKSNSLRFGTVMVWHKTSGHWKLLVRQGYKV